jgi:ABC-type multidrug transport system fused ATPase/permease subunit
MAITKAIGASGAFFGVIDSKRENVPGIRDPELSHADIVFENVMFAYPTRKEMIILKGFNARFERNKTTALVGSSGSGKSTIVALIERWYQLQSEEAEEQSAPGQIRVGAHNINDLDVKWWRSQIGLVQQEPFLFNDTIYNNVAFGLIGSQWEDDTDSVKMELITEACKQAFADEFIDRLPKVLFHLFHCFVIHLHLSDYSIYRVTRPLSGKVESH